MPTYEYICPGCEHTTDIFHAMSDNSKHSCPKCNSKMEKQIGCGYFIMEPKKETTERQIRNREDRAKERRKRPIKASHTGAGGGKGKALGGQHIEIDKNKFIKAAAKDPLAVKLAQDALKGKVHKNKNNEAT